MNTAFFQLFDENELDVCGVFVKIITGVRRALCCYSEGLKQYEKVPNVIKEPLGNHIIIFISIYICIPSVFTTFYD